jgi:hypothetical protein
LLSLAIALVLFTDGTGAAFRHLLDPPEDESTVEFYQWTAAPSMLLPRAFPAVIAMPDGDIMVIGGLAATGPTASTEIFDIGTGTWSPGPSLTYKRVGHTATLLKDGTVLVAGGDTAMGTTATAEVIDLTIRASSLTTSMSFSRSAHAAVLLPSGNVLVTGGTDWVSGTWYQAEMYDPAQHKWLPAGSMAKSRVSFTLQTLPDGSVLAIGGDSGATSEKYNPGSNSWSGLANMKSKRYSSSSVVLDGGKILVAGGNIDGTPTKSAETYDPAANAWSLADEMAEQRSSFSLIKLSNGLIMAAGSYSSLGTTASVDVYSPYNNTWWSAPSMARSRGAHGCAMAESGRAVYVIGGWSGTALTSSVERFSQVSVPQPDRCEPIDLVPLVLQATELPGHSENGFLAKLYAAQAEYESGDIATCLNIMKAFYNALRGFTQSGHITDEHSEAIYDGYVSVVTCLGGTPLPPIETHP